MSGVGFAVSEQSKDRVMLYESQVIEHVCRFLTQNGASVQSFLRETERGIDIEAAKGQQRIVIEAKGATSSKVTTNRYSKPFNTGQVTSHVSRAFFKAAEMKGAEPASLVAIALPDDGGHRRKVASIATALAALEIEVIWAADDGTVRREGFWEAF